MLFNSFIFLVFFAIVSTTYFVLPQKYRWVLLLVSSYIFYMAWEPTLIILIILSTASNYILAQLIYHRKSQRKKKKLLIISLIINFGLLFIFKYSMLINETFMAIYHEIATVFFTASGNEPERATLLADNLLIRYPLEKYSIILPMGISFYTFQAVAYTVDVYRGVIKPVSEYGIFSLYITFFPQLVAGPIERSKNLMPQFFKEHHFDKERVLYGLKIMVYGFFKKIVIADRLAIVVDTVYNNPREYSGMYLIVATLCFTVQLYCDFSGYSDIAIGSAKVLGFELRENFRNPYFSKSIREFWKRWHISLSSWFTDYVYIPLGGNRCSENRHFFNLLATFLLSGLWHGANWTFLLWGGLHGIYLIIEILSARFRYDLRRTLYLEKTLMGKVVGTVVTMIFVSYAWILFRANTVSDGIYIMTHLFDGFSRFMTKQYLYEVITSLGVSLYELQLLFIAVAFLFLSEFCCGKKQVYAQIERLFYGGRLIFYVAISTLILIGGSFYAGGQFIYFQF
ncbi:MAG: MBOAT family O-acyltransferase [Bacillota bacterium]